MYINQWKMISWMVLLISSANWYLFFNMLQYTPPYNLWCIWQRVNQILFHEFGWRLKLLFLIELLPLQEFQIICPWYIHLISLQWLINHVPSPVKPSVTIPGSQNETFGMRQTMFVICCRFWSSASTVFTDRYHGPSCWANPQSWH